MKLAIGGLKMTLNEFMVQPISKEEFAQYSKVLSEFFLVDSLLAFLILILILI